MLRTGGPPVDWRSKVRPLYKKRDYLRPRSWRPICCAVTEAKVVRMVVFRRIQGRLYEVGNVRDNMWELAPGRSTDEAGFLYNMYLDDEDLESFMASMDVKGAFVNTPHRLIDEVWTQLRLPYRDFVGEHLRTRRYTITDGEGLYGVGDPR